MNANTECIPGMCDNMANANTEMYKPLHQDFHSREESHIKIINNKDESHRKKCGLTHMVTDNGRMSLQGQGI